MRITERSVPTTDFCKPVKVFDFFCGCGGASAGFRAAGHEIAFGLDNDPDAAQSFQDNFPEAEVWCKDIKTIDDQDLDCIVASSGDHPLLFNVCAPCQPFSRQRRGMVAADDERIGLLSFVQRFIKRYRPDLIFAENVTGLRDSSIGRQVFLHFVRMLLELNYRTQQGAVRAQSYGVPQRRARLVLLASQLGPVEIPPETHGPGATLPRYTTVGDWIGGLPEIAAGESHANVPSHRAAGLSPLNLKRIEAIPPGGGWQDLPSVLLPYSRRSGFAGFTDVYGRLAWDSLAPALTTRCISFSNGRFGHPEQNRALSIREAACLQTFPLDYVLTGNLNSQARQVGNAVPVQLAKRFGEYFGSHISSLASHAEDF